ncbi:GNAT family N-acetyltransferase [Alkalibacterium gilvum]|uniref:Acetyltransferase (GNAT) domain-containing protein n=1 Tax=Alkalibacterium gilvum TaxID=1130080 RepID=A0A1H6RFL4_9LACT|nr:GNAT family N-acetyltransferase [Alkalibacterium gilvum]SEI52094.1 Acetyltransferase (GNAT) domain-containing protein [Alkalibacterium gilvum]
MEKYIKRLTPEDLHHYNNMQTGLSTDYMLEAFPRITDGPNHLFGLFISDKLLALSGFTLFKKHYAMLGRLRTDLGYRNHGYATEIMRYSLEKALLMDNVGWVGAYTEKDNNASQKVFNKIGLSPVDSHHTAKTDSLAGLVSKEATPWKEIVEDTKKQDWIKQTYLHPTFDKKIFPFEAYYPFPVSQKLFDDLPTGWRFYENRENNRFVILYEEFKGARYLHVVYPWHDFLTQKGLFKTIQLELESIQQTEPDTSIWWDFSEVEAETLPAHHPFGLGSPWILYGASKETLLAYDDAEPLKRANQLLEDVEDELNDLEQLIDQNTSKIESLENRLENKD